MRLIRILAILLVVVIMVAIAGYAFAWRSSIEPSETMAEFPPDLVSQGEKLAAVGNCIACHTVPGQPAFSGSLPLPTPFGTIYSTNITPDPETGIGRWPEAAFQRAMREGVDREGNHLYPAFPYDHFTLVNDEDNRALYAYLMTRRPVEKTTPANDLPFPLTFRPILAGWKMLFFDDGVYQPDPNQSAEWNRGAYLAEGLGHCGGCHTPRNAFGAEDRGRHFTGGEAEGWVGYAIDENSPAPIPWDEEAMAFYLRNGWQELHGVSRGPMAEVTGNLAALPDEDIAAISTYVVSLMGKPDAARQEKAQELRSVFAPEPGQAATADSMVPPPDPQAGGEGAALYASACATCHESGRPQPYGGLDFRLSSAINALSPQNIVNVTLYGLPPADGEASSVMPGFAGALNDRQIAEVIAYMRARFSGQDAWNGLGDMVRDTRSGATHVVIRPSDGIERAPVNVGAAED